ncbi:MAG: M20/M25/M40 family metallo-hydrolase [Erythrobacter sp.]
MKGAGLRFFAFFALALVLAGCARVPPASVPLAERDAIAAQMMADITMLASDDFGGRKPGTIGEARTLAYLTGRMREIGLVSGTNDPGSDWRAPVALVSTLPQQGSIAFTNGRRGIAVSDAAAAAFTPRRRELAQGGPRTGVEVIFAGLNPDNLTEDQAAGAIIVMLDEGAAKRAEREALFAKGAGAVLTVVKDEAVLARIKREYGAERLQFANGETNGLNAFITEAGMAQALGSSAWRDLVKRGSAADFAPVALDLGITIEATSQRREFVSHNLIGMIPGARSETGAVLLLAHWDHLGECGPANAVDRICNGAVDNASGVAMMLELARRLARGPKLDRDIYVLATTAEEAGLLGARAFAEEPPVPLEQFIAAFNFDMMAIAPAGSPVGIVGRGRTPFEPLVIEHLAKTRRSLGNRDFADSFLERQDGWALLREGVPTVLISSAFASREVLTPFLTRHYHQPSDRAERIELGGAVDDLLLHEAVIRQLADAARYTGEVSPP